MGLVAVFTGHFASRFIDEKTFNSLMLVVLFVGAGLMLFKGFVGDGDGDRGAAGVEN